MFSNCAGIVTVCDLAYVVRNVVVLYFVVWVCTNFEGLGIDVGDVRACFRPAVRAATSKARQTFRVSRGSSDQHRPKENHEKSAES